MNTKINENKKPIKTANIYLRLVLLILPPFFRYGISKPGTAFNRFTLTTI